MINVEMLSTGDEVLHGQIIDTNAAWLADLFFEQGLPLTRRNTVGDSLESLVTVLRERSEHCDVLIVNGGLGPTSDDLSALAAATAKGEGLVLHEEWLTRMERFFSERGRVMAPSNRKQAEIPASAELVDNPVGTACGFAVQLNRCLMFFTPGVPSEFKVMVEHEILPRLRERFSLSQPPLCLRLTRKAIWRRASIPCRCRRGYPWAIALPCRSLNSSSPGLPRRKRRCWRSGRKCSAWRAKV